MTTALDLITGALIDLGVYAPGETVTDADAEYCLGKLNDLLDSWSNESLACYANLEQSVVLQVGVSQYTIGSGGMIAAPRPLRIQTGPGAAYITDFNNNVFGVDVIPQDQWNMLGNRTVTSNIPDTIFYDPQYPLGIINVYPTPSIGYTLYFDSYLQLSEFSSLSTTVSFPPGYVRAIKSNLAIEVKPGFKDAQIDPIIVEVASRSIAAIKRSNIKENVAVFDPELIAKGNGSYNIYTDGRTP